jgi:hypothetical protein
MGAPMVKFSIVERNQALPELPRNEQIFRRVNQVMRQRYAYTPLETAAEKLAAVQAVLPDAMSVLAQLAQFGIERGESICRSGSERSMS